MATTAPETIYDFEALSIDGKPAHLVDPAAARCC